MLAETDIVEAVAERLQRYQSKTWYSTPLCWQKAATRCFPFGGCYAAQSIIATGFINNANLPEAAALLDAPHARTEQEIWNKGDRCWRWAVAQC